MDDLAALDVLLRRAQQAGAVRGDVRAPDLIVLSRACSFASLADISDPARRDLVFAVLADGLRPSRSSSRGSQRPFGPCGLGRRNAGSTHRSAWAVP